MVASERSHLELTEPLNDLIRAGPVADEVSQTPDLIDAAGSMKHRFQRREIGVHVRDDEDRQRESPEVGSHRNQDAAIMRAGPLYAQRQVPEAV